MEVFVFYRWSGVMGVVAGVLNVIVELLPERIGQPLDLLVNTLGLWGLPLVSRMFHMRNFTFFMDL
jgi:hypothetical protein